MPVREHREVEMVSFHWLVWINGADELDELRETKTRSRDEPGHDIVTLLMQSERCRGKTGLHNNRIIVLTDGTIDSKSESSSHPYFPWLCSLADIWLIISGEPWHVVIYVQHFDEHLHGGG